MKSFTPNEHFIWYLYFACERQSIFWNRIEGKSWPWTEDSLMQETKFTNVYKILDRATQFEIKNVIYNEHEATVGYDSEDIFWRILLYKHFNSPSTFAILEKEFTNITLDIKIKDITDFLRGYCEKNPDFTPYSNAYMLTAAFLAGNKGKYVHLKGNGWKKYEYYFYIFQQEIFNNKNLYSILASQSLEELYNRIISITSFADFLSYQYIIDLNYSPLFNFDENSFAVAGLGSRRGLERIFKIEGTPDYSVIINWVRENFEQLLDDYSKKEGIELKFRPLPGRIPTNVDLLNCACETDKMLRLLRIDTEGKEFEGKRVKNQYSQDKIKKLESLVFPPKWNVKL